ncbi:hypothetical protein PTSG_00139 [Salpingoeca rosetta]|uniref:Uncharacterized protein n=1 Tax=Salpingoeca rosetta (strain ATCC 50818 / BSB-021) TaxID=946362 RepID=F2TVM5_SALR5|nr:uncharacterized protein PTSG_00139 [Salpingoeca rosetta]EGD72121.1 hypothetical protein PTSG_00139 [Salpingoeca rosetta]|eukprot:XP_004998693.1 hypothetical protein PTSG_00139 [Salpingoeca rosetta]
MSTTLLELKKTGEAPSKNYHSLVVMPDQIRFTTWLIDAQHGVHHRDSTGSVFDRKVTFEEFLDGHLQDQIKSVFGQDEYQRVLKVVKENSGTTSGSAETKKKDAQQSGGNTFLTS